MPAPVFLLDTSALMTLRDEEPGAERVAELLALAASGQARALACFMTRMELLYRVWKDEGEAEGRLVYEQCASLPLEWVHQTEALLVRAGEFKALHPVSVADAWIAACADLHGAILVHKDPEFRAVPIRQEFLPFKAQI
jgi:predicted nucleic acid-binding protein